MKQKQRDKIRASAILIIIMSIAAFYLLKWIDTSKKQSDRILREHIIRGKGIEIKDRLDLTEKALRTLVNTDCIIDCTEDKQEQEDHLPRLLESFRTLTGASIIYIMDKNGTVKCSTRYEDGKSLTGNNYSFRYYFRASMKGKNILYPAVGVTTGKRGIYMSKPIKSEGSITGVAVAKIDMDSIDSILVQSGKILLLSSPDGIVFSSSSDAFLLKAIKPLSPTIRKKIEINRQYPDLSPEVLNIDDSTLLVVGDKSYRTLKRDLAIPDWSLIILTPSTTPLPSLSSSYRKLFITISVLLLILYFVLQRSIIKYYRKED